MRHSRFVTSLVLFACVASIAGLVIVLRPSADPQRPSAAAATTEGPAAPGPTVPLLTAVPDPPSLPGPTVLPDRTAGSLSLAPAISPEPPPDCRGRLEILEWVAVPATDWVTASSSSVVLGTVTEVGPGQWNTEDGRLPADLDEISPYLDVMRLLRISVDEHLAGEIPADSLTVWIPGGQIGCATFTVLGDYPRDLEPGQRFVFFLQDAKPRTGSSAVNHGFVMWPLDAQGHVSTPEEGRLTLEELRRRVGEAEQAAD